MSKIPNFRNFRNEEETIMKGTLKQTVNKFIFLFVVPLNILLIITNSFFMFSTYRQTKISTENMVNYFLDDIDSRLSTISFFLIKTEQRIQPFKVLLLIMLAKITHWKNSLIPKS